MSLVVFTNPADASTYTWEVNPSADSEQPLGKDMPIDRTPTTGNGPPIWQQGDDGLLILDWSINVRTTAMATELLQWYVLSRTQTIYVTDWDGEQYEGQITTCNRTRKVAAQQYAVFQVRFTVLRLISGALYDAGVTP